MDDIWHMEQVQKGCRREFRAPRSVIDLGNCKDLEFKDQANLDTPHQHSMINVPKHIAILPYLNLLLYLSRFCFCPAVPAWLSRVSIRHYHDRHQATIRDRYGRLCHTLRFEA